MTVRTLTLAGHAAEQRSPPLRDRDAAGPGGAGCIPRVLLVGRDLVCLRWMEAALAEIGFESITLATEVASAVMALRHGTYALVITTADLCGPDGGLALVRWLRSRGPVHNRGVPAVVLKSACDPAWIARAGDNGASMALRYPLNLRDFQLRMERLIQVRQLAASAARRV